MGTLPRLRSTGKPDIKTDEANEAKASTARRIGHSSREGSCRDDLRALTRAAWAISEAPHRASGALGAPCAGSSLPGAAHRGRRLAPALLRRRDGERAADRRVASRAWSFG